mmetsp:Transcript_20574/g.48485  ORF Transcript_20574/g.48485 Transcript_20574/m.48485 type:complete len:288 (-) Transcript_20574:152-1015(-)
MTMTMTMTELRQNRKSDRSSRNLTPGSAGGDRRRSGKRYECGVWRGTSGSNISDGVFCGCRDRRSGCSAAAISISISTISSSSERKPRDLAFREAIEAAAEIAARYNGFPFRTDEEEVSHASERTTRGRRSDRASSRRPVRTVPPRPDDERTDRERDVRRWRAPTDGWMDGTPPPPQAADWRALSLSLSRTLSLFTPSVAGTRTSASPTAVDRKRPPRDAPRRNEKKTTRHEPVTTKAPCTVLVVRSAIPVFRKSAAAAALPRSQSRDERSRLSRTVAIYGFLCWVH